jgi:hypothetical protein
VGPTRTHLSLFGDKMKRVLIATSSQTPYVSAFFSKSLAETFAEGSKKDIEFLFYWSPDELGYKNDAAEMAIKDKLDSVVFIKPHIQWVASDLVSIVENDSLIEGVPTKNHYSPTHSYKALLNNPSEDNPISARVMDLDMVKINVEVFERIKDFVITVNIPNKDFIEQVPLYFYATSDEHGPVTQDVNFCLAVEKAEIPIEVKMDMAIWEHVGMPTKTFIGEDIRSQEVKKGFREAEEA